MNERLAQLRNTMARQKLDVFYVRDTSNIAWLTGFDGVFDTEAAHALIVTPEQAVLHTDSRYAQACEDAVAAAAASGADCQIQISTESIRHAKLAGRTCEEILSISQGGSFGLESSISVEEYQHLVAATAECVIRPTVTAGVVRSLRSVKDADEINRMRAAQDITDAAFLHIVDYMQPGMTERQIQIELEDFMIRHGAAGLAFTSIVAAGANGAKPHAIPGETRLEAGQCVVLDFGARALGYCSDMTRVVFLGAPEPESKMARAWTALCDTNETVEAMLRPGITGAEAHNRAEQVLADHGFGGMMGHGLGHGVGLDIHEEPNLSPRNPHPLQPGNVVTVEPGIYISGEFGMRLEDFGVITADGFSVFTKSTHDMVII